MNFFKNDIIAL